MHAIRRATAVLLLLASAAAAQATRPAELPREQLLALYRGELADRFDEKRFDELLTAHRLIEQFFAARSAADRAAAVAAIEKSGFDAVTLGRICRIRLGWPDLAPGAYYVNERIGPHNVAYFLGVPKGYTRTRAWPLVVRLAPADPFVARPPPDQQQVTRIYRDWVEAELQQHPDALLLMPLLNLNTLYGPSYSGTNSVMQPIFHVAERVNVDPARVVLIGHSLGVL